MPPGEAGIPARERLPPGSPAPPSDPATPMATTESSPVARVYAEALLALGQKDGTLDTLAEETADLRTLLADNHDLSRLLTNPVIATDARQGMVQRMFEGKVSDTLYKFLQVLNRKGRLAALPGVCDAFATLVDEAQGKIEVDATVAAELDDATASRVADELGQTLGKQVTLTQHIDPDILGGMKLRIGDRLIDASVATRLANVRQRLIAAGREKAKATSFAD